MTSNKNNFLIKPFVALFMCLSGEYVSAQKIDGVYHPNTLTFKTQDSTYWIGYFKDGIAQISSGGYMGLMDSTGQILCLPNYDKVEDFQEGIALAWRNNKAGLIDSKGQELISPRFRSISAFSEGFAVYQPYNSSYKGVVSQNGKLVTNAKYHFLSKFKEGRATFRRDSLLGIIDTLGMEKVLSVYTSDNAKNHAISFKNEEWFLGTSYEFTLPLFEFSEGRAIIYKKQRKTFVYGFLDKAGNEVVAPVYDSVMPFYHGYSFVKKGRKWGAIDYNGLLTLPIAYETIQLCSKDTFMVSQKGQLGLLNSHGQVILPIEYKSLIYVDPRRVFVKKDTLEYLVNLKNNRSVRFKHDKIQPFPNGSIAVKIGKYWGLMNREGKWILPFEYSALFFTSKSGVAYQHIFTEELPTSMPRQLYHGIYVLFDENGTLSDCTFVFSQMIEFLYDKSSDWPILPTLSWGKLGASVKLFKEGNIYPGLLGVMPSRHSLSSVMIDSQGRVLHNLPYDWVILEAPEVAVVGSNYDNEQFYMKSGLVDYDNKILIPLEYDHIDYKKDFVILKAGFEENLKFNAKVVNHQNKEIIPFEKNVNYEMATTGALVIIPAPKERTSDYSDVRHIPKYQYGFVDLKGKILIPPIYDEISELSSGVFSVSKNGAQYLIDKNGNKIE